MTTSGPPKHDVHKHREITPKLGRDNWVLWKREIFATAKLRGIYETIIGTDIMPSDTVVPAKSTDSSSPPISTSHAQLVSEWKDRNNVSYNQILLCISPELQTAIDKTDVASIAWTILVKKFESKNPSKISVIRMRYENHHMVEGESVTTYITAMQDYRDQLENMGASVDSSYHAAILLRNLPDSWRSVTQAIKIFTNDVDVIEESLEAHEADVGSIDYSHQAATAFVARSRNPNYVTQPRTQTRGNYSHQVPPASLTPTRPTYICNNCGRGGHSAARCFSQGGGLAGQAPWSQSGHNNSRTPYPNLSNNRPTLPNHSTRTFHPNPSTTSSPYQYSRNVNFNPARTTNGPPAKDIVMMAVITEVSNDASTRVMLSINTSSLTEDTSHHWLIDSAATSHLCGNIGLFKSIHSIPPLIIETASGDSFTATQRGTIHITICSDPAIDLPNLPITLLDVIYVPNLKANLLSVGRMTQAGVNVIFYKDHSKLLLDSYIMAHGEKINNLYAYSALSESIKPIEYVRSASVTPDPILWHHRLAHTSYSTLEKMDRAQSALGFHTGTRFNNLPICANCPFGKQTRAPFQMTEDTPNTIGDIVASDLCGPFEPSIGGYRYFVTWLELKSRYASVEFLKNKECSTVTESFRRYMAWMLRQKRAYVKRIRTDNGGEYTGKQFQDICGELGIVHETTSPYTPEHNGIAERYNRTLQEGALTLRHDSGLSRRFWVSAIHTVNFVKNRILHSRINMSPYEAFWGSKPRIDWLRTYGSKCWALIPKTIRKKGDYRSIEGVFVGYYDNSKAYKIWIPQTHTILKTRDAVFDESNHIERVTIHATDEDDLPNLWNIEIPITIAPTKPPETGVTWNESNALPFSSDNLEETAEGEHEIQISEGAAKERSEDRSEEDMGERIEGSAEMTRTEPITNHGQDRDAETRENEPEKTQSPPFLDFEKGQWLNPDNASYGRGKRHQALFTEVSAFAHGITSLEHTEHALVVLADDEPANFREAMKSRDASKWKEACDLEYETLLGYHTWDIVDRPPNVNTVGSRWTYRIKRDNLGNTDRYKARLVAQGFSQVPGLDFNETYSPTIRLTSIRLILALACRYDLELRQIDVKGAYLNGKLEEDVYMKQPEGYIEEGKEDMVCKLNKGVYGLKQSGRVWHETLKREMEGIGFKAGEADSTIFFRSRKEGTIEMAGWYVDDGLLASNSKESMEHMVADIGGSFDIKDLGEPERLLGIKICRNRDVGTIHISQPSFISTIASRFNIPTGRPITSPMDLTVELREATDADDILDIPYASLIGSLNYCAIATRPDISYATNKCAQFTSHPTLVHWNAANRIVRYLLNTKDHGILYRTEGKGIQGHAHQLAGFTDADYAGDVNDRKSTTGWVFMINGAPISWASKKQGLVARSSMESELVAGSFATVEGIWLIRLGKDFHHNFTPIPIFTDNQSFIMFSDNNITNNRTKHIDIHYHYTQHEVAAGNIKLHYIPGTANPADILTKALSPRKHAYLLSLLGVCHA